MCILMAIFCGSFQSLDWRWVALLFTGLPPLLAIFIGFKNPWATLVSVFESAFQKPTERQREEAEESQVQGCLDLGREMEKVLWVISLPWFFADFSLLPPCWGKSFLDFFQPFRLLWGQTPRMDGRGSELRTHDRSIEIGTLLLSLRTGFLWLKLLCWPTFSQSVY